MLALASASEVVLPCSSGPRAVITCQPNCVCTGLEIAFVFSANAAFSNGGTVSPFWIVIFPPTDFELSIEYFLRERREVRAVLELPVDRVGERL